MSIPVNMSDIPPDEPLDSNHDINDRAYWRSRTPAERWACVYHLNREKYGDVKMDRSNLVFQRLTLEEFNRIKDQEYMAEQAEKIHP